MEDYELTMGTIEQYKNKACEIIDGNCDRCTAMYKYNDKKWCCFDTVNFFIKYANEYRKFKEKRCKVCVDLDRIYDIVCYIPTDSGSSIDLPVHYCPQCGRKLII